MLRDFIARIEALEAQFADKHLLMKREHHNEKITTAVINASHSMRWQEFSVIRKKRKNKKG